MARVLLIQPNENIKDKKPREVYTPLSLIYLATHIEDKHDVKIYDRNINWDDNHFFNFLQDYKPDIVGFTGTASEILFDIIHLGKIIKKNQPKILIIVGGVLATFDPDCFLNEPYIDYVIRGEGEGAFLEFCNVFDTNPKNLKNILNVNKNPLRPLMDMAKLKIPNYDLIDFEKYDDFFISLSRGCPGNCTFCYNAQMWGKNNNPIVRIYSLEQSQEIFRRVHDKYHIKVFHIIDDNFLFFKQRCIEICNLIKKYNFHFDTGGRADNINDDILDALKKAGCHTIFIGAESGSQRILNLLGKKTSIQTNADAIKLCKKHKIICDAQFMIGLPTETSEELKETINFIKNNNPDIPNVKIYNPLPAKLFDYCISQGLLTKPKTLEEWANFGGISGFHRNVSKIPDKELEETMKKLRKYKFLRRNIKRFIFWIQIGESKYALQTASKIIKEKIANFIR